MELAVSLQMTPRHLRYLYRVFLELKRHDPITMTSGPNEASTASMLRLLRSRREWVKQILEALLELAGHRGTISWDGFLFVFLRFCGLSKFELAQVLFFIIARWSKSWTLDFLTLTQLEEFYEMYQTCPIKSFSTGGIDFAQMPRAKYPMVEFIELVYRFSELINPCLYLQRSLQRALPSSLFWDDYDAVSVQNRKITVDFFNFRKATTLQELVPRKLEHVQRENAPKVIHVEEGKDPGVLDKGLPMPGTGVSPSTTRMRARDSGPPLMWVTEKIAEFEASAPSFAVSNAAVIQAALADTSKQQNMALDGRPPPTTVEEAKARILQTFGPRPESRDASGKGKYVHVMDAQYSVIERTRELDFIRRGRYVAPRRDSLVSILHRSSQYELIDRPL